MADKSFLHELREKKKNIALAIREESKRYFKEEAKELFEKYPKLVNFGWTQYTPYCNDGEVCEFEAITNYPIINDYDENTCEGPKLVDMEYEIKAVKKFLKEFDDDEYEIMFGDHVKVMVTRDGVEVEEYEHD